MFLDGSYRVYGRRWVTPYPSIPHFCNLYRNCRSVMPSLRAAAVRFQRVSSRG